MITVNTIAKIDLAKTWEAWTLPQHVVKWNYASADWHAPTATNDLRVGGKFSYRMEAKDGSMGFDFEGIYTRIEPLKLIAYKMDDDREAKITFEKSEGGTLITESFTPETENSEEMQRNGWQAILNNFKKYAEEM